MKGKSALTIFLGICVVLAILLITQVITPVISRCIFAISLVVFGGMYRGFRKT